MRDPEAFARQHITYEVEMLVVTAGVLGQLPPGPVRNAVLESFVVHARLLDDFLACDEPKRGGKAEDDVVARHYAPRWRPHRVLAEDDRDRANKLVAHLTTTREPKQDTEVLRMLTSVAAGLREFLDEVPERERGWFAGVDAALSVLPTDVVPSVATTSLDEVAIVTHEQT